MNKLSLLFVTLVVGTFMTFGETMWGRGDFTRRSRVVDQCAVDPSSVPLINRITQNGNIALLDTGLKDLIVALERNDATITQETRENKCNVLNRLGELLGSDHFNDAIKLKAAKILKLSCFSDCNHLFLWDLSKLLIDQLNENPHDVYTKEQILLALTSAAKKSEQARNTLVEQGIIGSVTKLVSNVTPMNQYVLPAAAELISSILSIKDLDSEKTHSLVPVLSELLKNVDDVDGSTWTGLSRSQSIELLRSILTVNHQSLRRIRFALDAVENLLTVQTCMEEFHDREKRCELIARLAGLLDSQSCQSHSLKLLEKLYGFTQDGPQETKWEPRLTRIRHATRNDISWYEQHVKPRTTHPIPRK